MDQVRYMNAWLCGSFRSSHLELANYTSLSLHKSWADRPCIFVILKVYRNCHSMGISDYNTSRMEIFWIGFCIDGWNSVFWVLESVNPCLVTSYIKHLITQETTPLIVRSKPNLKELEKSFFWSFKIYSSFYPVTCNWWCWYLKLYFGQLRT